MNTEKIARALAWSRIITSPVMLILIFSISRNSAGWIYLIMFATDALDGFFARLQGNDTSRRKELDTYGDVLYLIAGVIAFAHLETSSFEQYLWLILPILTLYLAQLIIALIKWGKPTSFHTIAARMAAVVQASFFIFIFFFGFSDWFFWIVLFVSLLDLVDELSLTIILKEYRTGIHSVFVRKKKQDNAG